MDRVVAVLLIACAANACRTAPARCGYADFAIGASHMTNPISTPFVVAEVRGRFVLEGNEDDSLEWIPSDDSFRFQLNGPGNLSIEVPVAADGSFRVSGLRPGRYCFRTSSHYFQGYEGVIVIDPRASDALRITVVHGV